MDEILHDNHYYVACQQSKFPWAIYRNKTQYNGKIYWNRYNKCWAIFQHIYLRKWDICHTVGSTFVSVCHLGLESLWHSSLPLCYSKNNDADWTGISWGVRKAGNHWARGPGYRLNDDWAPQPYSCRRCLDRRAVCGHRPGTTGDEFWSALCSVHSKTLSQTALHIVGRSWNKSLHLQPLQIILLRELGKCR